MWTLLPQKGHLRWRTCRLQSLLPSVKTTEVLVWALAQPAAAGAKEMEDFIGVAARTMGGLDENCLQNVINLHLSKQQNLIVIAGF